MECGWVVVDVCVWVCCGWVHWVVVDVCVCGWMGVCWVCCGWVMVDGFMTL